MATVVRHPWGQHSIKHSHALAMLVPGTQAQVLPTSPRCRHPSGRAPKHTVVWRSRGRSLCSIACGGPTRRHMPTTVPLLPLLRSQARSSYGRCGGQLPLRMCRAPLSFAIQALGTSKACNKLTRAATIKPCLYNMAQRDGATQVHPPRQRVTS